MKLLFAYKRAFKLLLLRMPGARTNLCAVTAKEKGDLFEHHSIFSDQTNEGTSRYRVFSRIIVKQRVSKAKKMLFRISFTNFS
jgi:hypothetical protein